MSTETTASRVSKQETTKKRDVKPPAIQHLLTPEGAPLMMDLQRAVADPHTARPAQILALQRNYGNEAVQRLLAAHTVQAKLTVGAANDSYEQEADRVAAQVMAMPVHTPGVQRAGEEDEIQAKPLAASITPLIQRQAIPEEEEEKPLQGKFTSEGEMFDPGADFESRLAATRGGGKPLPKTARDFMERRFGADFSNVRLHTGDESARLNQKINAQAFTRGQDVYLGVGNENGWSGAGQQLLAHELTHVLQQTDNKETHTTHDRLNSISSLSASRSSDIVQRVGRSIRERMALLAGQGLVDRPIFETNLAQIMTPTDNFPGREKLKLGIGEEFKLKAVPKIPTTAFAGELKWEIVSGAIQKSIDLRNGAITAVATKKAGAELKLIGGNGSRWENQELAKVRVPTVAPSDAEAKIFSYATDRTMISIQMILDYWLKPRNVSFAGIKWQECQDQIEARLTGNMTRVKTWADHNSQPALYKHHAGTSWITVEDSTNKLNQHDTVLNSFGLENSPGTFTWDIEWQYQVKETGEVIKMSKKFPHVLRATGTANNSGDTGTAELEKVGQKVNSTWRKP